MKHLLNLLGALALLMLLPSCQGQSDVEEATLDLSTESLAFAKEASEQTVTISTNRDTWMAFSPQEASWITLRQEGNTLHVKAEANEMGRERTGIIRKTKRSGAPKRSVTLRRPLRRNEA